MADVCGLRSVDQALHSGATWNSVEHWQLEADQYYRTYLNRAADTGGLTGWVQQLVNGADEEDTGHAALIAALYTDLLGRSAQSWEIASWTAGPTFSPSDVIGQILHFTEASKRSIQNTYLTYPGRQPDNVGGSDAP